MDDDLIDSSRLPLSRKSLLPGTGFFYPDSLDEDRDDERVQEAVEGAEVVVIADADADGLGSVALLREMYDAALDVEPFEAAIAERLAGEEWSDEEDEEDDDAPESPVALVGASPHNLEDEMARVAEFADDGVEVYVCDLCPDRYEYVEEELADLLAHASSVRWFDHHQWRDEVAAEVREAGVDLVVGESEEECTTDVALRSLDYEFDEKFVDLATVTRDHDLWLREDPRSDDLADYAYWTGAEEYVTVVGTYGAELPEIVEEYIAERRVEKEQLIDLAVSRAEIKEVGPWTVGITYGRCSQNEVAEALREQGTDAAVIVKPAGSASIRGTEGFERCHEVAAQVNGGGHPKAAGCKPDIYDDMLDYAHHWSTQGSAAKRVILAAFERLAEEEAEEVDDAEGDVVDEGESDGDSSDEESADGDDEGIETER
ncbi:Oligoribonuclease NrnB or cAMP/cGMP phosphodiesterase, DHH superfamily [Halogranum amylolyticum]|uniref:Oligoribonuclease NrnB or cAMP/cGMP phosphodiesterase, DHH superfamily n=1 Tax=Halogranum amylolyticum TaxID=660520 RepID=A0A1H8TUJ7_9EURY|nr:phosphohydrolase [Halogranum amylolyticum]SEO94672.1 Oligoribonuclease NrnB or cAMP/cGMP phosphodiesterase, DHH superfamily [Halogranum amylolyticum]